MINRPAKGFTLIELLVVVAVIAILAAIAVPNFLEAQVRSKVARAGNDLRTLALAVEVYRTDWQRYPASVLVPPPLRFRPLTTPVAYLSDEPPEIFSPTQEGGPFGLRRVYAYGAMPIDQESRWALASIGPDRSPNHEGIEVYPGYSDDLFENTASGFDFIRYDPTNGTISRGDLWRLSDRQGVGKP